MSVVGNNQEGGNETSVPNWPLSGSAAFLTWPPPPLLPGGGTVRAKVRFQCQGHSLALSSCKNLYVQVREILDY